MANRPINNRYYDLDYFNGSSASIYIGDVWVDEITSFSYSVSQNKTPIYGYASQLFDDTAAGNVIVQGQFTINYKEQAYLWLVLRRFLNMGQEDEALAYKGIEDPLKTKKRNAINRGKLGDTGGIGGKPITGPNQTKVSRASIERLLQGEATRNERYNFYHSLAGYASFSPGTGRDKIFMDLAETFEDQIWTKNDEELLKQIRRTDDNIFDGFDIYVALGNYSNPTANHTAQKIQGVRLLSQGKSIMVDGNPIQESYEFIARTVY